ncbi:hypothetical protein [Actinoplanes auranticolor]|uniref:Uncharacterized protein n=1 Tax=Actinoplanes auranticolor TaxID=47988 RepID=A0A919VKA3_9ACTN|nr:hypothetical protein [Actinoplanes auranticolor]GIM66020.1 hypothetical protein Aau02nite_21290 [Actinoplanes auranticolor]
MTRRAWRLLTWIAVPVVALSLTAVAAAAWWRWDTARQPDVSDAVPAMRRAVADAVVAAGAEAAVAVSGVVRSSRCRINAARAGAVFTARADLYTDPGGEEALITGIAGQLSGTYAVSRGAARSGARPIEATTDRGVRLTVRRISPGWVTVSARTGCSLGTAPGRPSPPPGSSGAAAITAAFAAVGTRPASFVSHQLDCPGGALTTTAAVSEPADSARLAERLSATVPAGARVFASGTSNLVAYRQGAVSMIVAASDDGTTITGQHTTACR